MVESCYAIYIWNLDRLSSSLSQYFIVLKEHATAVYACIIVFTISMGQKWAWHRVPLDNAWLSLTYDLTRCGAGEGTREPVRPGRANMCWWVCWCWCWCICWCWWMSVRTYGVELSTGGRPDCSWAAKNRRFNSSRRISWPSMNRKTLQLFK